MLRVQQASTRCRLCGGTVSKEDRDHLRFFLNADGRLVHEKCGRREMRARGIKGNGAWRP